MKAAGTRLDFLGKLPFCYSAQCTQRLRGSWECAAGSASNCAYLDFAGILGIVDVVKGLFDGLPESDHAVISQHQDLQQAQK